jgi:hypothetical protein
MFEPSYTSEIELLQGDAIVIDILREMIRDRYLLKRYLIAPGSEDMDTYIMADNMTFYDPNVRFWPHTLKIDGTLCTVSGGPVVANYQYLIFPTTSGITNLRTHTLDFWVNCFTFPDKVIWDYWLGADLRDRVRNPDCISQYMLQLQTAGNLIDALRGESDVVRDLYINRTVRDDDTSYSTSLNNDPLKELGDSYSTELDETVAKCNKTPYSGGIRLE